LFRIIVVKKNEMALEFVGAPSALAENMRLDDRGLLNFFLRC
jgi:hypothetical protein